MQCSDRQLDHWDGKERDSDNEEKHEKKKKKDYHPREWLPIREKEANESRERQTGGSKVLVILFFLNLEVGYPGVHFAVASEIVYVMETNNILGDLPCADGNPWPGF